MKFGEKLQMLRRARGLSQENLAEQLGVTRQAVSKWELGDATPDLENVVALSRFFGVSTDYLLMQQSGIEGGTSVVEADAPVTPKQRQKPGFAQRLSGWICIAMGAASWLVIWILSTMIQGKVQTSCYNPTADCYEILTRVEYSFAAFVQTYRLSAVLWVTGILAGVGLGLLLYSAWKRRHPERTFWDLL